MRKIIFIALLIAAVPAFASDNDQGARKEDARKEMRALQDKHMQERRALEDEMHGKMREMRERHQKENAALRAKYGMDKGGKGGMEGKGGMGGN